MLTRREFNLLIAGLTVAGGATLLDACQTQKPASTGPKLDTGPAQMTMNWWGSPNRASLTNSAFSLFEQKHSQYGISGSYKTAFGDYWDQMASLIAASQAPDLMQMDVSYIAQYANKGYVLDLTPYAQSQISIKGVDPGLIHQGLVGGKLYGVPIASNTQATFVNMDILSQAGLSSLPKDWTWNGLANFCTQVAKHLPAGVWPMDDAAGSGMLFRVWLLQHGSDMYTPDGRFGASRQQVADWFQFWQDLREAGGLVPMAFLQEGQVVNPGTTLIALNKVLIGFDWSNQLAQYLAFTKENVTLAPVPQGTHPGSYLKASQLLSISATTKYPSQAAQFINFWINDVDAAKILGIDRGLPVTQQSSAAVRPTLTAAQQAEVDFMVAQSRLVTSAMRDPSGSGPAMSGLTQIAIQLAQGKLTVASATDQFIQQANSTLTGQI